MKKLITLAIIAITFVSCDNHIGGKSVLVIRKIESIDSSFSAYYITSNTENFHFHDSTNKYKIGDILNK